MKTVNSKLYGMHCWIFFSLSLKVRSKSIQVIYVRGNESLAKDILYTGRLLITGKKL